MNALAQLSGRERREVFDRAAARMGVPTFHVEKDFWVCWVLNVLFRDAELGPLLTFRGGTSLAKAWGVIRRFSEDVDLALARGTLKAVADPAEKGIATSQRDRRLSLLREECRNLIRETLVPVLERAAQRAGIEGRIEVEALDQARDPFCIYFYYPQTGQSAPSNYIQPRVKVELSGRAEDWPMQERTISPYVANVVQDRVAARRLDLVLKCVKPERTFWEKAALLHEHHTRPGDRPLARAQARHLYDLVRLWESKVAEADGFRELFEGVKIHREVFFGYGWIDYGSLQPADLRLSPDPEHTPEWRLDYEEMSAMFHETRPPFDELLGKLRSIESALSLL